MQRGKANHPLRSFMDKLDDYLLPVALGCLTLLIVVQSVSHVPAVRRHIDASAGRFVSIPSDVVPDSAKNASADIELYLSPDVPRPDIQVFVNQKPVASFTTTKLQIHVRNGDQISLKMGQSGEVTVTVDHNNARLFEPAPGYSVTLRQENQAVPLSAVEFTQ